MELSVSEEDERRYVLRLHDRAAIASKIDGRRRSRDVGGWWQLFRHARLGVELAQLKAAASALDARLDADADIGDRLVTTLVLEATRGVRRSAKRHPFAPRDMSPLPGDVLDEVMIALKAAALGVGGLSAHDLRVANLPRLDALRDRDEVARRITTVVHDLSAIASSTQMIDNHQSGCTSFVVQHAASGLRAQFSLPAQPPGTGVSTIGNVLAKPYRIDSIGPDPASEPSWNSVVGLGIGERIYLHAASLAPGVRWSASVLTDRSRGLRHKLHAQDPYIWEARGCEWCEQHLPLATRGGSRWAEAGPTAFSGHQ